MRSNRVWAVGVAGFCLMGAGTAGAQEVVERARDYVTSVPFTLSAGAGYMNFTDGGAQDVTSPGGSWTVRGVAGMFQPFGAEVAYNGASIPVDTFGTDGNILETGLQAMARAGLPIPVADWTLAPYATLGLGWNYFNLVNSDENLGNIGGDNVLTIPFGAGLAVGCGQFSLDTRVLYRPTYGDDLFNDILSFEQDRGANSWSLSTALGYTF